MVRSHAGNSSVVKDSVITRCRLRFNATIGLNCWTKVQPCISLDTLISYQGIRACDEPGSTLRPRVCDVDQASHVKFSHKTEWYPSPSIFGMRLYVQGECVEMTIIGIDVSKAKLDCLWLRDAATGKVKSKIFSNNYDGHQALIDWSIKNSGSVLAEIHFFMEATGVYHETLAYALHGAGAKVFVINPAQIKSFAQSLGVRTKTDKRDSMVIARYGAAQQPRLWQPEPIEIRTLKALITRYEAVCGNIQREKNRLEKVLVSPVSSEIITSIKIVLEQLNAEKKRLEDLINRHIDQHPNLKEDRALLESIPGVGRVVSCRMISVIRSREFDTAPQCAAYLGLIPIQHQSGTSVRGRSHLSKAGNAAIRAKLYMAAVVAIQHNPDIKEQYQRLLKRGKSKMSALGAAMRKLVQICFGVLKHQTPYQPQVN